VRGRLCYSGVSLMRGTHTCTSHLRCNEWTVNLFFTKCPARRLRGERFCIRLTCPPSGGHWASPTLILSALPPTTWTSTYATGGTIVARVAGKSARTSPIPMIACAARVRVEPRDQDLPVVSLCSFRRGVARSAGNFVVVVGGRGRGLGGYVNLQNRSPRRRRAGRLVKTKKNKFTLLTD
jgi:hypothetical protein